MISLRLIPPGEIDAILLVVTPGLAGDRDAILLVVTPGLVGEMDAILLVVTPGLDITFGSTKLDVSRDSALAFLQSASRVNEETYCSYISHIAPDFRVPLLFLLFWTRWRKFLF
jgi:hypothetical protein